MNEQITPTVVVVKRRCSESTQPNSEREFLFDCKLFAAIRVKARSREQAEAMLREAIEAASCNAGAWPDGSPILFEVSIDGELDLIEVDGHAM